MEVLLQRLEVINPADKLPFPLEGKRTVLHGRRTRGASRPPRCTLADRPPGRMTPDTKKNGVRQVNEELRLTYRYLDLRRPELQNNIRLRSRVVRSIRECLYDRSASSCGAAHTRARDGGTAPVR